MTSNTMADLKREVAKRLRDTLHGREIDTMEKGMPETEHMLGIVTIGAITTPEAEKGSLLDPHHEFWSDYYETVETENKVRKEVQSAIRSLREDDVFRVSTPYGEEAGIWYCEVGDVGDPSDAMTTTCAECGTTVETAPELKCDYGKYRLTFAVDCGECDFSAVLDGTLVRR